MPRLSVTVPSARGEAAGGAVARGAPCSPAQHRTGWRKEGRARRRDTTRPRQGPGGSLTRTRLSDAPAEVTGHPGLVAQAPSLRASGTARCRGRCRVCLTAGAVPVLFAAARGSLKGPEQTPTVLCGLQLWLMWMVARRRRRGATVGDSVPRVGTEPACRCRAGKSSCERIREAV